MIKNAIIALLTGLWIAPAVSDGAADKICWVFLVACAVFYVTTVAEEIWDEIMHKRREGIQ